MKKPNALDAMSPNSATAANNTTQLDKAREAGSSASELKPRAIFGVRHVQCILIFFGLAVAYSLRVNMSVAIVVMTDQTTNPNFAEYPWTEKTRSLILSSFFWGYVLTQVPSGQLAQRYGAKMVVFYGVLICSTLNILTPWCARIGDWPLICTFRVIQGLCQGCIFPSTHTLISKWAPVEERGKLGTFSYAGTQFGTALMLAISGELASSSMGWPSIFYFSGGAGVIWGILWFFFASSSPAESRFISDEERRYIEVSQGKAEGEKKPNFPTPWKNILTSVPFLVLLCSHCANNWGFWTLLTEMPTYMKNVLGMDIKSNAILSSLPYWAMCALCFVFAFISEVINRRKCMSLNFSRKFFNSVGLWIPMLGLIGLGYIDGDQITLAIVLLTLTVGMNSACYLGFQVNHIDLSPNFAGTLMGITNCAANIMSIIAPLIVGVIVYDEKDPDQWRIIFFIAAGFYMLGNLLFVIFGKTEPQFWNEPQTKEGKNTTNGRDQINMESQN